MDACVHEHVVCVVGGRVRLMHVFMSTVCVVGGRVSGCMCS